jgi:hypothetical protein
MSLDKPGAVRLDVLEKDMRDVRDFMAGVKGALRLVVAIQGVLLAGLAYTIWQGFPR